MLKRKKALALLALAQKSLWRYEKPTRFCLGPPLLRQHASPLQEYCAAAMISATTEANHDPQVVEFLAPVRVARKDGGLSRSIENETRIRFQMCCRRTLTTRSNAAASSGEGLDTLDAVKELVDMLSAYQLKRSWTCW